MPLLILLLTLIISSCGSPKDNAMRGEQSFLSRNENKVFMTIDHSKSSLLRQKLLNTVVQSAFKEPLVKKEHVVESRDEFIIGDKRQEMLIQDEVIYKENEQWMTKVVVSYEDRLEIYFVPDGILVSRLITVLNLKPDNSRTFLWVNPRINSTQRGNTLYLLSLSHDDLILNDQDFYQEEYKLGNQFSEKVFSILKNQKIKLKVNYEFFVQAGVTVQFKGANPFKCTRELAEMGDCSGHHYKRVVNGGSFEKTEMLNFDLLGFEVVIDNKSFLPTNLRAVHVAAGSFSAFIDTNELVDQDSYNISFKTSSPAALLRPSHNFDITPGCRPAHTSYTEAFGTQSNFSIEMVIFGRGEKLRTIIL
jgi:hypothetical protein